MIASLPFALTYNLNRLGQAGDQLVFSADEAQRAAIAAYADILEIPAFEARIVLTKTGPDRFALAYDFAAQIVQACVVTLEPLPARVAGQFRRELHFSPPLRRGKAGAPAPVPVHEITVTPDDEDPPEEIDSPHYDLAGPLMEEFLLALDPYPRAPGVEFTPPDDGDSPENPFAVLKGLKSDN